MIHYDTERTHGYAPKDDEGDIRCGVRSRMPKAKPDKVIVHRLELQQSERDAMEAALTGRFVTGALQGAGNLLKGIGAALMPFQGALTALAAVYIADKSWDQLKEKVLDPIIEELQAPVLAMYAGDYAMIVAWLNAQYANDGWNFLENPDYSSHDSFFATSEGVSALWRGKYDESYGYTKLGPLPVGSYQWVSGTYSDVHKEYRMPGWLVDRFDSFIYTMKQPTASNKELQTPSQWWVQFYPYDEFENEIIWYAKNR